MSEEFIYYVNVELRVNGALKENGPNNPMMRHAHHIPILTG
jgi:hypothetical protein